MRKTLDEKIERLLADSTRRDFILADAKDADMGAGVAACGPRRDPHGGHAYRSLSEFRQLIREITQQGLVDVMLMSASNSEVLTIEEQIFANSCVTPAVRVNDSTDIWLRQSGKYAEQLSLPFQTTTIEQIRCGHYPCAPAEGSTGADLGLYSLTFNNDARHDRETLAAYRAFRLEAERQGFRHFLEVFAPNAPGAVPPEDVGRFVIDHIVRTLAGVTRSGRPLFLKTPYFGPAAMETLVHFDATLVVGILGGAAGTTHDAFHMLWEAKRYGARAAIFGRKINHAEDQLLFVKYLRAVADDDVEPAEAVRAYHGDLQASQISPTRPLAADLELTQAPR